MRGFPGRKYPEGISVIFILGLLTLLLPTAPSFAEALRLPDLIGNHMVLQSGKKTVVWGQDQPGQKIFVTLDGLSSSTRADKGGKWKVHFSPQKAGGPFEMVIQGSSSVTIQDVMIGEVWMASGQSNMEFKMDQTQDGENAIRKATDGGIRLFLQKPILSAKPLGSPQGEWKVCSPETVQNFSAVAYYFGANLRQDLKIPVGLIDASWGGSYVESWIPEASLKSNPAFKPVWNRWNAFSPAERAMWEKGRFAADLQVSDLRFIPRTQGQEPLTVSAMAVSTLPQDSGKPGFWGVGVKDNSNLSAQVSPGGYPSGFLARMTGSLLSDGWGWMTTPLTAGNQPLDLRPYSGVEFYAKGNGKYILFLSQPSVTDWDNYRLPKPFVATKNWQVQRIPFSALRQSGWGKAHAFTPEAIQNLYFGVDPKPIVEIPSALYNGMIHPWVPFPIEGVIWYQGEANSVHAAEYSRLLKTLITSWRKSWKEPEMPFILAQLPNFAPTSAGQGQGQWALLREQQSCALSLPHTALAVLIDSGIPGDIHPKNKAVVGYRMAQAALASAYGRADALSSPVYDSMKVEDGKIFVYFKNVGKGLMAKGGSLLGFEVAGQDGSFKEAEAKIEGERVVAWSPEIPNPTAIRYAWADNPPCNLYGQNGFPVSPFRAKVGSR